MRVPAIENVRCNERLFWKSAAIRLLGFYVMVGRSYGVEFVNITQTGALHQLGN